MSTILVTGSEGTLGRRLVAQLRRNGHDVYGLDIQHQSSPQYIRADVRSYVQMERAISERPYDMVFHLAAEFGRHNGEEYYETLWSTNAIGTRHILELQKKYRFKLVFTSSSEIYGEMDEALDEDITNRRPVHPRNDYAISKWVNELQIMHMVERHGLDIVRIRLFNAYGPGETYHPYRSVVCLFCWRALNGMPFTVYKNYSRAFMYVDDLVPTFARVADTFTPGRVYNIAGQEIVSVETLADMVLAKTGASRDLITYLGQDVHNVVSKMPNTELAMKELGHNPTTKLVDGLDLTIDWMRSRL